MAKRKLISKALQNAIDDRCDFMWTQDHLKNIFLCKISFHQNGRAIYRKFASFYAPEAEELKQALELHHAVFDAISDHRLRPYISAVLGNLVWQGVVDAKIFADESERESKR